MKLHLPVVPEAFPTELAVEGCLAGVGPHVDLEPVLVNIAPLAVLTHQRIVNLVSLFVDDQLVLCGTDLGAHFAFPLHTPVLANSGLELLGLTRGCRSHRGHSRLRLWRLDKLRLNGSEDSLTRGGSELAASEDCGLTRLVLR